MKIAINSRHSSFSPSIGVVLDWINQVHPHISKVEVEMEVAGAWMYVDRCFDADGNEVKTPDCGEDRACPVLISLIEKYGEAANSKYSKIKIVEIPDDVEWVIKEYDGVEWVAEKHRTWS